MALLMPTESSSSRDKPSKSPWGVQGPVTTEPLNASLLRIGFEEPLPMGWAGDQRDPAIEQEWLRRTIEGLRSEIRRDRV